MTAELYWMALTTLMTALFWIPYVLDRLATRGLWATLSNPKPEAGPPQSLWAQRAIRAHANAIENLAIFVPAVLGVQLLNLSSPATGVAAASFFFARLIHFVVYTFGVPVLRTLAFAAGWAAQIVLLARILNWI
jgi:uncharacterized MAPEG superfamily protein